MDDRDSEQQPKLNWEIGRSILTGKIDANHLYYEQFETVKACCEEAAGMLAEPKDRSMDRLGDSRKDVDTRDRNTVIGVVGERGSGKTSFLYSLKESLDDEYFVLDVVDPSDFDSGMSVLELFLAQMFNEYKRLYPKYEERHGELFALPIHSNFKDLAKTLSALRTDGSVYSCENPSIEVLANMADRMAVREDIRELCKNFLHLVNGLGEGDKKPCIVLLVDDVDLAENGQVYRMLDDVRKFLSGNIIVVLSYRESQLLDSVVDRKIKENERLLNREVIALEEARKQASRLVSKLLPENRTVRLYGQNDLMGKPLLKVLKALESKPDDLRKELIDRYINIARFGKKDAATVTVEDWINDVLYANTLIKVNPVYILEKSSYAYPESMRDLVGFVEMVQLEMEVPPVSEGGKPKDSGYYRICHKNLERYRKYLLSRLPVALGNTYVDMIAHWRNASAAAKNHYAYKVASSLLEKRKDELDKRDLLAIDLMLPENVTVGDVSDVLGRLCRICSDDSQIVFFCYVMKVLYSIELLDALLTALLGTLDGTDGSPEYQKAVDEYLTLVNACIIPPEVLSKHNVSEMYYPLPEEVGLDNDKCVDPEAYPWFDAVLGILAYTKDPTTSISIDNSRPFKVSRNSYSYKDEYNRPLFFLEAGDLLHKGSLDSVREPTTFRKKRTYWISPFSLLAKREYVIQSLQKIKESEKGAYLFYSLFDVDVFRRMTFNLKVPGDGAMSKYLKRLNSAILHSFWYSVNQSPKMPSPSDTLMRINNKREAVLLRQLCTTFVTNDRYRLFDEDVSSDFPTLSMIDRVYALSLFRAFEAQPIAEDAENDEKKPSIEVFIKNAGKNELKPFVVRLAPSLKYVVSSDDFKMLYEMMDYWETPYRGVLKRHREKLEDLLKSHPREFLAAYQE